jgi:hypothetical protein
LPRWSPLVRVGIAHPFPAASDERVSHSGASVGADRVRDA